MSPEDEQQKIDANQARLAKQERTICLAALLISSALARLGLLFVHVVEDP